MLFESTIDTYSTRVKHASVFIFITYAARRAEDEAWEEYSDDETGGSYYFNFVTGESTYDRPACMNRARKAASSPLGGTEEDDGGLATLEDGDRSEKDGALSAVPSSTPANSLRSGEDESAESKQMERRSKLEEVGNDRLRLLRARAMTKVIEEGAEEPAFVAKPPVPTTTETAEIAAEEEESVENAVVDDPTTGANQRLDQQSTPPSSPLRQPLSPQQQPSSSQQQQPPQSPSSQPLPQQSQQRSRPSLPPKPTGASGGGRQQTDNCTTSNTMGTVPSLVDKRGTNAYDCDALQELSSSSTH